MSKLIFVVVVLLVGGFIGIPVMLILQKRKNKKSQEAQAAYDNDYSSGNYQKCLSYLRVQYYASPFDDDERRTNIEVINKMVDCMNKLNKQHDDITAPAIDFLNDSMGAVTDDMTEEEKEVFNKKEEQSLNPVKKFLKAMQNGDNVELAREKAFKKGLLDD